MSITKRTQIKYRQEIKRKKRREKLRKKGLNPDDFFGDGHYLGKLSK